MTLKKLYPFLGTFLGYQFIRKKKVLITRSGQIYSKLSKVDLTSAEADLH